VIELLFILAWVVYMHNLNKSQVAMATISITSFYEDLRMIYNLSCILNTTPQREIKL